MTHSNDPRNYTKEQLEHALRIAARLVEHGFPTWPFEMVEEALALHDKDDVRSRALKLAAQTKQAAP